MIKRLVICAFAIVLTVFGGNDIFAQQEELLVDSNAVVTNSFWDNWYAQVGVDMSLQNPYGSNFLNVIPNGQTFGIDFAVGKWLTPKYGIRGKVNLENVITELSQVDIHSSSD